MTLQKPKTIKLPNWKICWPSWWFENNVPCIH